MQLKKRNTETDASVARNDRRQVCPCFRATTKCITPSKNMDWQRDSVFCLLAVLPVHLCSSVFVRVRPVESSVHKRSDNLCSSVFVRVRPVYEIHHRVDSKTNKTIKTTILGSIIRSTPQHIVLSSTNDLKKNAQKRSITSKKAKK